ncbi:hypothetical protein [Actinoplanes sp. NPDC051411]|uniref:hypothetical protein n=1 Tax=Actinoplanes sp. NPDC051411 TaxID=3155522 RepID=UPI003431C347
MSIAVGLPVARGAVRLGRLHAISRRIPTAVALHAAFGALLAAGLHYRWTVAGGPAAGLLLPLVTIAGTASVTAVSTHGPFGDSEEATGRWLPWLRLTAALTLTATAYGSLAAAATFGPPPGGDLALLRDVAGSTGLGLLTAVLLGGAFGWTGPMAYYLATEIALTGNPTTPWIWTARPPHDVGANLCAGLVFIAGIATLTARGSRGRTGDTTV